MAGASQITPEQVLKDTEFQSLPTEERRKVLSKIDPDFIGLDKAEQDKVLTFNGPAPGVAAPPKLKEPKTPAYVKRAEGGIKNEQVLTGYPPFGSIAKITPSVIKQSLSTVGNALKTGAKVAAPLAAGYGAGKGTESVLEKIGVPASIAHPTGELVGTAVGTFVGGKMASPYIKSRGGVKGIVNEWLNGKPVTRGPQAPTPDLPASKFSASQQGTATPPKAAPPIQFRKTTEPPPKPAPSVKFREQPAPTTKPAPPVTYRPETPTSTPKPAPSVTYKTETTTPPKPAPPVTFKRDPEPSVRPKPAPPVKFRAETPAETTPAPPKAPESPKKTPVRDDEAFKEEIALRNSIRQAKDIKAAQYFRNNGITAEQVENMPEEELAFHMKKFDPNFRKFGRTGYSRTFDKSREDIYNAMIKVPPK